MISEKRTKEKNKQKLVFQGAGHMVPTDRPGPMLQLINNFVTKQYNFNTSIPFDLTRQPLLPQFLQTGSANPENGGSTFSPPKTTPTTTTTTTTTVTPTTKTPATVPTQPPPVSQGTGGLSVLLTVVLSLLIR